MLLAGLGFQMWNRLFRRGQHEIKQRTTWAMKTFRCRPGLLFLFTFSSFFSFHSAGAPVLDWPQFRGRGSSGIAEAASPPIVFGPKTNLLWETAVPAGHSSPIVVGNRVIFNGAEGKILLTCALDANTGRSLWRAEVPIEKLEKFHQVNSATPCTPVTDGQKVISYLPSFGLIAHDLDGKELWRKPLPLPQTYRGQGSGGSPALVDGLVILQLPLDKVREVLAVRASDGAEVWKAEQPLRTMGWATPVTWRDHDTSCVGVAFGGQFSAYRIKDGKELWWVTGLGAEACATPVVIGETILLSSAGVQGEPANVTLPPEFPEALRLWDKDGDGQIARKEIPSEYLLTDRKAGGKGDMTLRQIIGMSKPQDADAPFSKAEWDRMRQMIQAFRDGELNRANVQLVRLGGEGDVTKTHLVWQESKGIPEIPSPLVLEKRVYLIRNGGLLACRDLATGKVIYDERIEAPGGYYASPLAADGRIYLASDRGVVTVLKASDHLEVLARNDLSEPVFASPAAVKDILYIRSNAHLWAFRQAGQSNKESN